MKYRKLVGFGEAMLRLTAPHGHSLEAADSFHSTVGGAELNGLIAAARTGMESLWVTSLADNALGARIIRHARENGVQTWSAGAEGEDVGRMGLYFMETATPPRSMRILYDRGHSAFSGLDPDSIDWHKFLDDETCLYLTGISPALGEYPRRAFSDALACAAEVGSPVAFDINYRSALWRSRDEAFDWYQTVLPAVDILSVSAADLESLGIQGSGPERVAIEMFELTAILSTSKRFTDDFVDIRLDVHEVGTDHHAEARAKIVDPLGSGDALFGTFIGSLPTVGFRAATSSALGAAVSCYGLFGDALTSDPWDSQEFGGIIR